MSTKIMGISSKSLKPEFRFTEQDITSTNILISLQFVQLESDKKRRFQTKYAESVLMSQFTYFA